jgi:hypothetical protein
VGSRGGIDTVATGLGSIGAGIGFDHPFEIGGSGQQGLALEV